MDLSIGSVFALLGAIAVDLIAALAFGSIAREKGFSKTKYFWFCFLLGPIGYLLVIALPDRGTCTAPKKAEKPSPALPVPAAPVPAAEDAYLETVCPDCGEKLAFLKTADEMICPNCGKAIYERPQNASVGWACIRCGACNDASALFCSQCGRKR